MGNFDKVPPQSDYSPAESILNDLGVSAVISASGTVTRYGGSRLRPEIMDAMQKASNTMVNIDDLNIAAGKVIARYTGAEAGLVTSGAAGGLVLQAAAVIAGKDPAKMKKLPDTDGMKNEIIIHKSHRFPYDQCYLSAGAKFVEIGDGRRCNQWELESAFTDNTAAVAYLFSPFITRRALPFSNVCDVAHELGVPVIVDAASYTPPRANLTKFISDGADMVIYSGGKGVRGPQGTGILCGRKDLIEAAYANASPHQFIGRGMKVAKEEIIGLIRALEIFDLTGKPPSEVFSEQLEKDKREREKYFLIELELERDQIKRKIHNRTINMFVNGWINEVKSLLKNGVDETLHPMQSVGYKQIIAMLNNEISKDQAIELISTKTWQYAKKQLTWLKKMDIDYKMNIGEA